MMRNPRAGFRNPRASFRNPRAGFRGPYLSSAKIHVKIYCFLIFRTKLFLLAVVVPEIHPGNFCLKNSLRT